LDPRSKPFVQFPARVDFLQAPKIS
jgi:hypothetical protein